MLEMERHPSSRAEQERDIMSDIFKDIQKYCPELLSLIENDENIKKGLAEMKEFDEENPYQHSLRVSHSGAVISEITNMIKETEKKDFLTACLLHDYGKTAGEQSIYTKEGALTAEEREKVKEHPLASYEYIKQFNPVAAEMALGHHEHWVGKEYPRANWNTRKNTPPPEGALRADQTAEEYLVEQERYNQISRIIAILDSFDALINQRSYNVVISPEEARAKLERDYATEDDKRILNILVNETRKDNPAS